MRDESRPQPRPPKGLPAILLSVLLSVGGGGGTAWLVSDVRLAWLRADLERAERRLDQLERLERDGDRDQARLVERVEALRVEVAALRADTAAIRTRLEGLRWGGR